MNTIELIYAYFYFILCSMAGWLCEDVYVGVAAGHFVNRGFFYGPYCPIYGFGALIVLYLLNPFHDYPVLVFVLGVILTSALEYFTSWAMETLFHEKWWDYSKRKWNIKGRVCARNSFLFGIMALVLEYVVRPLLEDLTASVPLAWIEWFEVIFTFFFILDFIFTLHHMLERRKLLEHIHEHAKLLAEGIMPDDIYLHAQEAGDMLMKIKADTESHLAKAFPDRQMQDRFAKARTQLHEFVTEHLPQQ